MGGNNNTFTAFVILFEWRVYWWYTVALSVVCNIDP